MIRRKLIRVVVLFNLFVGLFAGAPAEGGHILLTKEAYVRMWVVKGDDDLLYYTFQRTRPEAGPLFPSAQERSCRNPFFLAMDFDANGFPDNNSPESPLWLPIPGQTAVDNDPVLSLVPDESRTQVLMEVRGLDGAIYETSFRLNCEKPFFEDVFNFQALGLGDTDKDGWPNSDSTASPWVKITGTNAELAQ